MHREINIDIYLRYKLFTNTLWQATSSHPRDSHLSVKNDTSNLSCFPTKHESKFRIRPRREIREPYEARTIYPNPHPYPYCAYRSS